MLAGDPPPIAHDFGLKLAPFDHGFWARSQKEWPHPQSFVGTLTHFLPPGLMTFFRNEPPQIVAMAHEAKRKPRAPSESACPANAG